MRITARHLRDFQVHAVKLRGLRPGNSGTGGHKLVTPRPGARRCGTSTSSSTPQANQRPHCVGGHQPVDDRLHVAPDRVARRPDEAGPLGRGACLLLLLHPRRRRGQDGQVAASGLPLGFGYLAT